MASPKRRWARHQCLHQRSIPAGGSGGRIGIRFIGRQGAASADPGRTATHGIAVSGYTSTPYNVSVGGTDFGDTYAGSGKHLLEHRPTRPRMVPRNPTFPRSPGTIRARASCSRYLPAIRRPIGPVGFCNSSIGRDELPGHRGWQRRSERMRNGHTGHRRGRRRKCAGYDKPSWQSVSWQSGDGVAGYSRRFVFRGERSLGTLLRGLLFRHQRTAARRARALLILGRLRRDVGIVSHHGGNRKRSSISDREQRRETRIPPTTRSLPPSMAQRQFLLQFDASATQAVQLVYFLRRHPG